MQTIEEIYRARLSLLASEAGSQRKLAEKLERSPSQINQWINGAKDSKTGKPRSLDKSTARYIEKMTGKPEGWMDQPLPEAGEPEQQQPSWPFSPDLLSQVLDLNDRERLQLEGAMRLALAQIRPLEGLKKTA